MLRVGLVGTGVAAQHHARALVSLHNEGILRWSACCGRDEARLRDFCSRNGAPVDIETGIGFDWLVSSGTCDALVLATPDDKHADQAVEAAAFGLGVLVEKPLALTEDEGSRVINAARHAGTCLRVGYHLRYHGAHHVMASRRSELVGDVRTLFLRWALPDVSTGWRARGDAVRWSMAALGTHCVDLAMCMVGNTDVAQIVALRDPPTGVDRSAEVTFRLGSVLVHVSVSVDHLAPSRVIMTGDRGELETLGTLGTWSGGTLVRRVPGRVQETVPYLQFDPYEAQLRAFVAAFDRGFQPDPTLLANLNVIDRAWNNSETRFSSKDNNVVSSHPMP